MSIPTFEVWRSGPKGKDRRWVMVQLDGTRIVRMTAACRTREGAVMRDMHEENAEPLERVRDRWEHVRGEVIRGT